jgi:uncharacterized membrane protein YbhN (UPF0104 family)
LAAADPLWLLAAVAANLAIFPLWATQWSLLTPAAQRVSWTRMLQITALCSAAKNTLPYTGLPSAIVLLLVYGRLSRGAAISTIALDQLCTGLAKVALVAAAVLIVPLPSWMRVGAFTLLLLVMALLVALLAVAHGRDRLRGLAAVLPAAAERLLHPLADWAAHLEPLRSWARAWPVVALALGKKALEIVAALAVQQACGIPLSVETAVLIVAALSVATMLPAAPANLGVYEATVLLIYQWSGVPAAIALAAAVLQHAMFLAPALGCGYLVILSGRSTPPPPKL